MTMRAPASPSNRLLYRRHGRHIAAAAVIFVLLLALRGRRSSSEAAESEPKEKEEEEKPAGYADSYLHHIADAQLTRLLDEASKHSPLMECAANLHVFEFDGHMMYQINDACSSNETLGPTVSGIAKRMPCGRPAAEGGKAVTCCDHPVTFRLGTTDFNVFQQVFEKHFMRYLYALFADEPPRYVLDAGANAGFSSMLYKLLWPDATVVSLEPDAGNFAILDANTKSFKDVHPLNAGLWSHVANITMTGDHGNWGRVFKEAKDGAEGMPAYGVQDVADKLGIPAFDFVKIDIEGAEGMVFRPGADVKWIKKARAVSLEIHDYFAGYFGLKEVSTRVDAAFNTTGYTLVSDNEHILYLKPSLRKALLKKYPPAAAAADAAGDAQGEPDGEP